MADGDTNIAQSLVDVADAFAHTEISLNEFLGKIVAAIAELDARTALEKCDGD